ncbi:ABC1 kinase family protein [Marinobacterium sp. YM272]|uniref:ABC1 kinase family protein n=1 Tax=Marinobacterium sp. YM272 TaxID=3421654 RepID=UPI003D7FB9FB
MSRMARLGGLAGRIAGNVLADGGRHLARGKRPAINDLLLTPRNLTQVADKLATMRGAAMKVGQLISMDAGTLLPRELAGILDRLRQDAVIMPSAQLVSVLEDNWGEQWDQKLARFSFEPIAAASIGQVHQGLSHDGDPLAIKIQYPGVRESIDSDIANVCSLLRIAGLLPRSQDIEPLIEEAKQQLKQEADYLHEGAQLQHYRNHLAGFGRREELAIPRFYPALSTDRILVMEYLEGRSLEQVLTAQPQLANRVVSLLMELFFAELFDFHAVQTDPNPANYLYSTADERLVLLDFGAVRHFSPEFVSRYGAALSAAADHDRQGLTHALEVLGFFRRGDEVANRDVILDIFLMAAEPLRQGGAYNFGGSDLARRIHSRGMSVSRDPEAWHTPPPDVLFLHRKMAGLYLLAARFGAVIDVATPFRQYL